MKNNIIITIAFIFFTNLFSYASTNIERKVLVLYSEKNQVNTNSVHMRLESILNYYGYYAEHISTNPDNYPSDISSYAGLIYWNQGEKVKEPLKLVQFISKFKDKKNIFIGDIPTTDINGKNYIKEINQILKDSFGFHFGGIWIENPKNIKKEYDKELFDFEMKISFFNQKYFTYVITDDPKIDVVFKEYYRNKISNSAFFAPWGFYAPLNKVFYDNDTVEGKNRWIINPFKLIEKVYETNYPIPETSTKNGKRVAYIHLDGDGILSKNEEQKYTIERAYNFIKEQKLKTGVSFIVSELDKKGPILKNEYTKNGTKNHDYKLLNSYAKKILELPNVEPATHTYSHPFNWRKGIVSYSVNKDATKAFHGDISAYQEPDKQVNLNLEIQKSIDYIQKLIPNKKVNTIYWSGDCYPSLRDLQYVDSHNLLAFNGGDNRFDLEFNSYSYVTPLSLYSKNGTQIYSSNSNENTYTGLWTENHWRFKNVIKTFENTGYPKRIKPANTYYHFYSFEHKASYNSLKKIYSYLHKNDFEFIYPSEFIKIAKNFHDIKIEKINDSFKISNIKDLREFRFEGEKKIYSDDIKKIYYDKKLNVTYITLKNNINSAILKIR